jgi:hypothetical protein
MGRKLMWLMRRSILAMICVLAESRQCWAPAVPSRTSSV